MYMFFLKKKFTIVELYQFLVASINSKATIKIKTRHFDMFLYICLILRRNVSKNAGNK